MSNEESQRVSPQFAFVAARPERIGAATWVGTERRSWVGRYMVQSSPGAACDYSVRRQGPWGRVWPLTVFGVELIGRWKPVGFDRKGEPAAWMGRRLVIRAVCPPEDVFGPQGARVAAFLTALSVASVDRAALDPYLVHEEHPGERVGLVTGYRDEDVETYDEVERLARRHGRIAAYDLAVTIANRLTFAGGWLRRGLKAATGHTTPLGEHAGAMVVEDLLPTEQLQAVRAPVLRHLSDLAALS